MGGRLGREMLERGWYIDDVSLERMKIFMTKALVENCWKDIRTVRNEEEGEWEVSDMKNC